MTKSSSKAIKAIHFADLHLGMDNYGKVDPATGLNQRFIDFLRNLQFLVDYAIDKDISLVVFAGDAYKNQKPSPTLQRELAKQVKRLAKAGIEVFLLVGNHDLPQAEKHAHALSVFSALEVERVTVGRRVAVYQLETKDGPVDVAALPHLSRSFLLSQEEYKEFTPTEVEKKIELELERRIELLASEIRPGVPSVLAAHLSVSTAVFGSERSTLISGEMTISPSALARGFDYVALGHIHKHQDLSVGYPPIVYSGSLDRVDFGEEADEKGFCLVNLVKSATSYEFIPAKPRRFETIVVECSGDDPTEGVLAEIAKHNLSEAVVRLRIQLPVHLREHLRRDEVVRALDSAYYIGPIEVELVGKEQRSRNPNLSESKAPLEALEQFILTRDDLKLRSAELMAVAKEMIDELEREKVVDAG